MNRQCLVLGVLSLCFVTSSMLSGCVLGAAAGGAEAGYVASQEERTAGETIDDQLIVSKVKTKLLSDPEVSGLNINVDSYEGVVTLRGRVDSDREASEAIRLARDTTGVRAVRSELTVAGRY